MSAVQGRLLLTGFEPFGGSAVNPSGLAAGVLARVGVAGFRATRAAVLPVVGGDGPGSAAHALLSFLSPEAPFLDGDVLVCLGESMRTDALHVERVAVNRRSYRIADNAGTLVTESPVVADGPAAHFSTLPIEAMCAAVRRIGTPCLPSDSAGQFLCNEIMYHALLLSDAGRAPRRCGFVHVPQLPEQAAQEGRPDSCLALEETVRALHAALSALASP